MIMNVEELGTKPISEAAPGGEDIRYAPEMESLAGEMEKLNNPSLSSSIDWPQVQTLSEGILRDKSKDILVACYMAVSLQKEHGVPGLNSGVLLLRLMTETFWDSMYPVIKRMRGRQQAIQWWAEKTTDWLKNNKKEALEKELFDSLNNNIDLLENFLSEAMEEPPSLFELKSMIGMFSVNTQDSPESEPLKVQQTAATIQSPSTSQTEEVNDAESAHRALKLALQDIVRVADYMKKADPADAEAYRLSLLAVWTAVTSAPPATNGRTLIPAPPKAIMQSLATLRGNNSWEGVLDAVETNLGDYLFWFDLAMDLKDALINLSRPAAASMVEKMTAGYVERIRGTELLQFADGTPFASDRTRLWLRKIIAGKDSASGEGATDDGTTPKNTLSRTIAEDMEKAATLAKNGSLCQALEDIEVKLARSASACESLLRRTAMVTFLTDMQKNSEALPHLEKLHHDLVGFNVALWDPPIALDILSGMYVAYRVQDKGPLQEKATEMLSRIAEISPSRAISIAL